MKDIIQPINTKTDANESNSSVPEKKLSSEQKRQMRCLCGDDSLMIRENVESTVPSLETSQATSARNLYDKRIKLLIASGLVAGITPTSERKQSPQQTLDFALFKPDGKDSSEKPEAD